MIEDDIYGSQKKKNCFHFVRKNILAFNLLKKNNLVFWQKKKKRDVSPKISQAPPRKSNGPSLITIL